MSDSPELVPVLAVDDQPENLLALKAIFVDSNIDLISVNSGSEALKHLMHEEFAVILMDAFMPDMDGFETAQAIRQREKTRHQPIIFLTATHKDSVHATLGYDIGAVDYIYKPVVPEILKAKVSVFADLFNKNRKILKQSKELESLKADLEKNLEILEQVNKELSHLGLIVESTEDAIFSEDVDGIVLTWNPGAERIFGYKANEIIGQSISILIPEEIKDDQFKIMSKIKDDDRLINYETVRRKKDGKLIDVSLTVSPLKDPEGRIIGASKISRDITLQKMYENELTESKRELELLNESLVQAKEQAVLASQFKSQFLANMSHEIRTPMNGVLGMCNIMLNTDLDQKQREYALAIKEAGGTLLTIINDVLDFSKIEAGHLELEYIDFDPVQLVEGIAQLMAPQAQTKQLSLMTYIDPATPARLRGDPERIKQILTNLVGNAIKFTESGEVVIRLIVESLQKNIANLLFEVKDNGIGLDEEEVKKLFQPFVQADGSISRKFGGTGLGLSICKRLVNKMNGSIGVETIKSSGSTFWFRIPLEARSDAALLAIHEEMKNATVLVVDDEPMAREIMQKYIESWGMRTLTAASGEEAFEIISENSDAGHPIDIAILDLAMPKMDGIALAKRIMQKLVIQKTKLILLTTFDSNSIENQSQELGFRGFLNKPIRQSQMLNCLIEVFRSDKPYIHKRPKKTLDTFQKIITSSTSDRLILAVDDYPINQQVIQIYLEEMKIPCHIASNGVEALELFKNNHYSLILMDCQMPEMDGFAATSNIRKLESMDGRQTPIVAMTAFAMDGDRNRCLTAGMNDYISKPIDPATLRRVILKWLPDHDENQKEVAEELDKSASELFDWNELKSDVQPKS